MLQRMTLVLNVTNLKCGKYDMTSIFLFPSHIAKKLNFLLYGVKSANYDINCALFRGVQIFIINTNRFSMATV